LPRVATCFGAGLGRRGEICGALAGALIAFGLQKGRRRGKRVNLTLGKGELSNFVGRCGRPLMYGDDECAYCAARKTT